MKSKEFGPQEEDDIDQNELYDYIDENSLDDKKKYNLLLDNKKIDIFQHLRLNLKNEKLNCKDNNRISKYCIPCKQSTCEKCTLKMHKKHILLDKTEFDFNEETIDKIFNQINQVIYEQPLFRDYKPTEKLLLDQIDEMVNMIYKRVEKMQKRKKKEITDMFNGFTSSIEALNDKLKNTKAELKKYYNTNKKFFNYSPIGFESFNSSKVSNSSKKDKSKYYNTDDRNSLFLINYELLNLNQNKGKEIYHSTKKIVNKLEEFNHKQKESIDDIINGVDKLFFGEYNFIDDTEDDDYYDDNNICNDFRMSFNLLKKVDFSEVKKRIHQYNVLFDNFRKTIYETVTRFGNLKEIEGLITGYELNKKSDSESQLFARRAKEKTSRAIKNDFVFLKSQFNSKDDIILNHHTLLKYFSYVTMELYEKNFKASTKELQSSHADLMIQKDDDGQLKDFAKAIENTNLIYVYNRKERTGRKIKVELKKNPIGYTKFPNGVRCLLLGDNVYITGGVDQAGLHANVLIFNIKKERIKRIMDLVEPRAYHSMVCLDVFNTLMVIGGEDNSSVEIFDPVTNRWTKLPNLNVARANAIFQFDKPRGLMYVMFGMIGKVTNKEFSDAIEYMDLKNINHGWIKLSYNNKSELDLKTQVKILEISNDLTMIFGGFTARDTVRNICVLDKEKKEILKCDTKMLEAIRNECKINGKLGKLMATITLASK